MKKFARYLFISAIFFEGLQSLSYGRVNLKGGVMNIDMFGEDFGLVNCDDGSAKFNQRGISSISSIYDDYDWEVGKWYSKEEITEQTDLPGNDDNYDIFTQFRRMCSIVPWKEYSF